MAGSSCCTSAIASGALMLRALCHTRTTLSPPGTGAPVTTGSWRKKIPGSCGGESSGKARKATEMVSSGRGIVWRRWDFLAGARGACRWLWRGAAAASLRPPPRNGRSSDLCPMGHNVVAFKRQSSPIMSLPFGDAHNASPCQQQSSALPLWLIAWASLAQQEGWPSEKDPEGCLLNKQHHKRPTS